MKKVMCGNEMDRMPNWAFRMMSFMFNISDKFKSPDRRLDAFGIQQGQTVVDWGCGTGRFLKPASVLAGESGTVYAVDIHELAVESAYRSIKKFDLKNVHPVLTDGKSVNIPPQKADLIYALDMFHMVKDTNGFLNELYRITKPDGILYLEDGHQPRAKAKEKVNNSGRWEIIEETKAYMKCKPKNQTI
jgi:ubiquinone/menaquinone biosynthesis C-methylase UbiE